MKAYKRLLAEVIALVIIIFIIANAFLFFYEYQEGKVYRVEVGRLAQIIEDVGIYEIDLKEYAYVTGIREYDGNADFWDEGQGGYSIREINGKLYRFDHITDIYGRKKKLFFLVNGSLFFMSAVMLCVLIFVMVKIIKPFNDLTDIPYELAKGNLVLPIKENKNRFFGKFLWGIELLRETLEQQKQQEYELLRERKTLVLSISHDIKTPLSAIKLYSKALLRELYPDREKQNEIAQGINEKADEIEKFVAEIISASKEDFLRLETKEGEFYLSALMDNICSFYKEKLALAGTEFEIEKYADCILNGDLERSIEVIQNIIENAIKYGDGDSIGLLFSEEEDCQLITVKNSGCSLPEAELPHIFESFWRGSNSGKAAGSGLGLYICRQLMRKMGGEIFAEIGGGCIFVTVVFVKAGR